MGFLFFKSKQIHPAECIDAYNKLSHSPICTFYLEKIPKYCAIDKILWIEAGVIENDIVKSFRINYYSEEFKENVDTKISFRKYGHQGMTEKEFSIFMQYLSVALHKNKFMFIERGFDNCSAGCVYNRKYAKKMFSI